MPEIVDAPTTPTPEKASLLEDFIDIFTSPSKVFARRADSGFVVVTLVLTLLIGVLYFANRGPLQGIMDAEFNRAMATAQAQNPNMTADQMEGMRGIMEMSATVGVIVFIPLIVLALGFATWLVTKLFGGSIAFKAGLMIAAYSYLPRVVESVLVAVQGLVLDTSSMTGRYQLSLGVGRFMDPATTSAGLLGVVGRIDLITIWITLLLGIGISVVAKIPREKGMMAAAVIWVVGAVPALIQLMMGT